jgi:hypothetical protein
MSRSPAAANQAASGASALAAPAGSPAPCAKTPRRSRDEPIARPSSRRAPPGSRRVDAPLVDRQAGRGVLTIAATAAWISGIGPFLELFEPATIQPKRSAGPAASLTGRAPLPAWIERVQDQPGPIRV